MNGKIYKIVTAHSNEIYIGSTINSLDERLQGHEQSYIKWLNSLRNYCTSYEILKYGDYSIELLEDYPCLNRYELNYREGYYQLLNFLNCVNTVISGGKKYRCQNLDNTEKHHMCYCGRIILNNLKSRYKHTKTFIHKQKVLETHKELNKINNQS